MSRDREQNLNSIGDLANKSFDGEYKVFYVEPLTMNPVSGKLERGVAIQGNDSKTLAYNGDGSLNTITKTIGADSYVKTLTYDGSGVLTGVSVWI